MANPRKFSEKIALHTQKQAEETAAFEAIMREVSGVSRVAYQKHHLQLSQNLGAYRGGSLPNVNQIGTNSIDLQNALHNLEDMKQGRQTLVDRMHRERSRQIGGHRGRPFPFDKRIDCSPYGSAYLSPPPDTSWRRLLKHLDGANLPRTNSDSALHTSAMAPVNDHSPTTSPSHRIAGDMMVGENTLQADGIQRGVYWDPKRLVQSRPKSCEVPNINIYPSQEQDSGVPHIPISNNTGSLPDLTSLHFPSPMATPLDVEPDGTYSQGGSPANLSPTSAHHMGGMVPNPGAQPGQQQSPVARRRHPHGGPSPLVLTGTNQMRLPLSPPDAQAAVNVDPSQLLLDPRIRQQYVLYLQQQQRLHQQQLQQLQQQQNHHQQQRQQHHPAHHAPHQHQSNNNSTNSSKSPPSISPPQVPQIHISCPQTQVDTQPSMTQYRNSTSDTTCQSPTSPLSQPSYSPSQSPGLPPSTINNSPFADAYYLQQQQQQQQNSLQHQFEQFSMLQDNQQPVCTLSSSQISNSVVNNGSMYPGPGQPSTVDISQVGLQLSQSLPGDYGQPTQRYYTDGGQQSPHRQQGSPQQPHLSPSAHTNNKIPDIIFTGADDPLSRQDFAKELGNAITGMSDSFDTDFFPSDEALKAGLDPLDLDGLQMLTADPNMVADPATEDTFRLDRL